jgi:hypothetical protein
MKQSINFYQFRQAFYDYDRQTQFPNGGLSVLFDYLEALEEDIGEELELDVIALCCDYYQMSYEDIAHAYSLDVTGADEFKESGDEEGYQEAIKELCIEYLQDNTSVVGEVGEDEIIFQCF